MPCDQCETRRKCSGPIFGSAAQTTNSINKAARRLCRAHSSEAANRPRRTKFGVGEIVAERLVKGAKLMSRAPSTTRRRPFGSSLLPPPRQIALQAPRAGWRPQTCIRRTGCRPRRGRFGRSPSWWRTPSAAPSRKFGHHTFGNALVSSSIRTSASARQPVSIPHPLCRPAPRLHLSGRCSRVHLFKFESLEN